MLSLSVSINIKQFKVVLACGIFFGCCEFMSPSTAAAQSGWVRQFMGEPCGGVHCPSWQDLDRNGDTVRIAASGGHLYQLQVGGNIWRFTGTPCDGYNICPAWEILDNNPATREIVADGDELYQLHADGSAWRFTGAVCVANSCEGWAQLRFSWVNFAAGGGKLAVLSSHVTGFGNAIFYGTIDDFTTSSAPISNINSATYFPGYQAYGHPVAIALSTSGQLFTLMDSGSVWYFRPEPKIFPLDPGDQWQQIDNNGMILQIAVGGQDEVYELRSDGSIWAYLWGHPCTGWSQAPTCMGWQKLDINPATVRIVASNNALYKIDGNGLWRYTGTPCTNDNCPGWERLMGNNGLARIAADGSAVYQLNQPTLPAQRLLRCDECR